MAEDSPKSGSRAPGAKPATPDPRLTRRAVQLQVAGVGMEFVATVLGGTALGYYLDDWLGTAPFFLMLLIFTAMGGSVARLLMLTRRLERLRRAAGEEGS